MINVSNSFLNIIKNIFKEREISMSDYVFCFTCGELINNEVSLNFLIVPLEEFESDKNESQLPFINFILFKKGNYWLSSDVGAFFHLINKRISTNKKGEMIILKAPEKGKYSICGFVGSCLLDYLKNEKLTKQELSENLGMKINRLNSIFKGQVKNIDVKEITRISSEFKGKNKILNYFVLVEKIEK